MFKVGQLWRAKASGNIYLVTRVRNEYRCDVSGVAGSNTGQTGWLGDRAAQTRYELIGNNYQERSTVRAEGQENDIALLTLLTLSEADKANGRLVSKTQLLDGIDLIAPATPSDLPGQRGCRKEDC